MFQRFPLGPSSQPFYLYMSQKLQVRFPSGSYAYSVPVATGMAMIREGAAVPYYSKSSKARLIGCMLTSLDSRMPVTQANRTIITERTPSGVTRRHSLLNENMVMKDTDRLSGWDRAGEVVPEKTERKAEVIEQRKTVPVRERIVRRYHIGISADGAPYCTL